MKRTWPIHTYICPCTYTYETHAHTHTYFQKSYGQLPKYAPVYAYITCKTLDGIPSILPSKTKTKQKQTNQRRTKFYVLSEKYHASHINCFLLSSRWTEYWYERWKTSMEDFQLWNFDKFAKKWLERSKAFCGLAF